MEGGGKLIIDDFSEYDFIANNLKDFDVIIIWGMIYLQTRPEMLRNFKKVASLLNSHGKVYFDCPSRDDFWYGKGDVLEEGWTYRLNDTEYSGLTCTFLDACDIAPMLKEAGLKTENLEREDWWKNNLTERRSHFLVSAVKAL